MSGPNPESGSADDEPGPKNADAAEAADAAGAAPQPEDSGTFSQAYSAPESEQFLSGPYLPVDPHLYDYDSYSGSDARDRTGHPRWPWVVGVTTIVAAIALVVSVALLVARTETSEVTASEGSEGSSSSSTVPVQDEVTTNTPPNPSVSLPPPPPPEPSSSEEPPPPPAETPAPEPPPPPAPEPSPSPTPARPRQVTYSVTGTKAPFDQITITYIDASGHRQTQNNAYIPWSLTLTPISQSEVGSVEASSMLRLSKLNCTIIASDGTVLSSNANDAPQTSC